MLKDTFVILLPAIFVMDRSQTPLGGTGEQGSALCTCSTVKFT
jgi:hypothetical protein